MGTNNKYKDAIECVYLVVKNGLEQDIPQIDDAETKSKIEFILLRIRNVEKYCDNIYAYFFKEQKSVYVGRTININLRNDQHKTDKSSSVLRFATAHNTKVPQITILERFLTIEEGVQKEDYYCNKFAKEGWKLINKAPTGDIKTATGTHNGQKWSYEQCYEQALKYTSVIDFRIKNPRAYAASVRRNMLKDFDWMKDRRLTKKGTCTFQKIYEVAKKYKTTKDFIEKDGNYYRLASKNGWLHKFFWLDFERKPFIKVRKYSKDGELVKEYKSINQASKENNLPYTRLYNCCKSGREYDGYIWKFA